MIDIGVGEGIYLGLYRGQDVWGDKGKASSKFWRNNINPNLVNFFHESKGFF